MSPDRTAQRPAATGTPTLQEHYKVLNRHLQAAVMHVGAGRRRPAASAAATTATD